jgi:hypothetical protein
VLLLEEFKKIFPQGVCREESRGGCMKIVDISSLRGFSSHKWENVLLFFRKTEKSTIFSSIRSAFLYNSLHDNRRHVVSLHAPIGGLARHLWLV